MFNSIVPPAQEYVYYTEKIKAITENIKMDNSSLLDKIFHSGCIMAFKVEPIEGHEG